MILIIIQIIKMHFFGSFIEAQNYIFSKINQAANIKLGLPSIINKIILATSLLKNFIK